MLMTQTDRTHVLGALALLFAFVGTVGTALAFEHIGGYIPCALCLLQREPYYVGIPVAALAALAAGMKWPACVSRGALVIIGLLMVYGVVLSGYHSGVEWSWWQGPADCAAAATSGITTDASDLLGQLDSVRPPSCDKAAGRFLGLSFAGWNVIASAIFAYAAFRLASHKSQA